MRTLPLRLCPVDGESLPGYVARYAHTFQFPPGDLIRTLGLDGGSGCVAAAGRYGVCLSPERLEWVSFATGIEPARLERMLLARYAGLAFDRSAVSAPIALAGAAQGHEVLIWCSRFCPHCLRADGAWRLRWQLGWSVVCIRHQTLLVRRCPRCDGVPEIGPRGRWQQDDRGLLTDPGRCSHRPAGKLCRTELARTDTVGVAGEEALLAAQARIDALLDGQLQLTLAGVELQPPVYLRDLLTLCNLLDRQAHPRAPGASRVRRRLHDHPAALAAVLPEALALADLPNPDTLAEALRELADDRYRADGQTLLATKSGPMSEQLKAVVRLAVSQPSGRAPRGSWDFTQPRTAVLTTSTSACSHGTSRSCSGLMTTTARSPSCSSSTTSPTGSGAGSARCCSHGCSPRSTGTPLSATSTSQRPSSTRATTPPS